MALRIPIEDYGFNMPSQIREEEFWHIKKNLHLNPFYQMEPPHETAFEKFKSKIIGGAVGAIAVIMLIGSNEDGPAALGVMILFFGVIFLFKLSSDLPNYQSAVNIKKNYFAKMREVIIRSDDYSEFKRMFYHEGK